MTHRFLFERRYRIAYFTMEISLRPEISTFAGGLGVLAGDTARSCADLELPVVFVTLVSRQGYLRQEIDAAGRQVDHPDPWDPAKWAELVGTKIAVHIEGRPVWIQAWLYAVTSPLGQKNPVLLLDTCLEENSPEDRRITDLLYGGDSAYRLKQQIVLGIGGWRMLQALGLGIETYHLNEGHAALLAAEDLRHHPLEGEHLAGEHWYDVGAVRSRCVFTTHTPVEAAHDRYDYGLVERMLGGFIETVQLRLLAGEDQLNMTRLALNLSGYVNGVAQRHAEQAARMFPGYRVRAVTNGIHVPTWAAPSIERLYSAHFRNWAHEPEVLVRVDRLDDAAVWAAHQQSKLGLIEHVGERAGVRFAADVPIIGFARRMTGYKRPDLLFQDMERLIRIHSARPFQVVLAGIAHPRDLEGKKLIERIHRHIGELSGTVPVVFLANYDTDTARLMVSGADIWLNTPLPPMEASGTSGMKAALNGTLNLSVLDGWWLEAWIEGVTGWAIGRDGQPGDDGSAAEALYEKIEATVLPKYYEDREGWIWMMKQSISKIACFFNSQRMMRRYAAEAYLRY